MGRAVCAGQGQGMGDGDRVGSLGVQGQRVAENAVPSGIGRIVTGNALQYIRRQVTALVAAVPNIICRPEALMSRKRWM